MIGFIVILFCQSGTIQKKKREIPDNSECLKCHGSSSFTVLTKDSSQKKTILMNSVYRIDQEKYCLAAHGIFKCTDCHDEGYKKFPHDGELKNTEMLNCLDCHEGKKKFKKFHFENISSEALKSIHFKNIKTFTCWKCHNPHIYSNTFVTTHDIKKSVVVCNSMCLDCHDNKDKLSMFAKKTLKDIASAHINFPFEKIHLAKLRCTDCHAQLSDSIASPHNIVMASMAVKNCNACHSADSRLKKSLFKLSDNKNKLGFNNSAFLKNKLYIMGASNNKYIDALFILLAVFMILTFLIHFILIKYFNKKTNE